MSIGILLIDISILKSLYVFCQMYLEDTFRKNLVCSSEMSLTVMTLDLNPFPINK